MYVHAQEVVKAALFGEHAQIVKTHEENVYRIFMDMNGDYYPENIISSKELEKDGNYQLSIWAEKFPGKFREIAESYNLQETNYSETNFRILQDSIISRISFTINKHTKQHQTWIIHGFRKKLHKPEGEFDHTSLDDNIKVRANIDNFLEKSQENMVVEVYWDGRYDINYSGLKSKINLGKIFKYEAIPNARRCGYSLRSVFTKINAKKINIISHSTGTHVVTSLIFNKEGNETTSTPHQDLTVLLVASASSGIDLFEDYYNRNTTVDYKSKDNYSLINYYNKKDHVLRKGGFPKKYGNTTLGCNFRGESKKLKNYFNQKFPNSSYTHQPTYNKSDGNHYFWMYTNAPEFTKVLSMLF